MQHYRSVTKEGRIGFNPPNILDRHAERMFTFVMCEVLSVAPAEIVENTHRVSFGNQAVYRVAADEACTASYDRNRAAHLA
jgi:hypothetical protein